MNRILKWHRLAQLFTTCIYFTAIPFLVMFIIHIAKPESEWIHPVMVALKNMAISAFIARVLFALFIKSKIWKWEQYHNKKLSDRQLIHLL